MYIRIDHYNEEDFPHLWLVRAEITTFSMFVLLPLLACIIMCFVPSFRPMPLLACIVVCFVPFFRSVALSIFFGLMMIVERRYRRAYEANAPRRDEFDKHYSAAHALYDDGKQTAALQEFGEAISIDPLHPWVLLNRAYLFDEMARADPSLHDKALEDYSRVVKLCPWNAAAFAIRGDSRFKFGDYKGAMADYNISLLLNFRKKTTSGILAKYGRERVLVATGRTTKEKLKVRDAKKAVSEYTKSLEKVKFAQLPAFYGGYYTARAEAYMTLGRFSDALRDLDKAIELGTDPKVNVTGIAKLSPVIARIYQSRGDLHKQLGNLDDAQSDFDMANLLKKL